MIGTAESLAVLLRDKMPILGSQRFVRRCNLRQARWVTNGPGRHFLPSPSTGSRPSVETAMRTAAQRGANHLLAGLCQWLSGNPAATFYLLRIHLQFAAANVRVGLSNECRVLGHSGNGSDPDRLPEFNPKGTLVSHRAACL